MATIDETTISTVNENFALASVNYAIREDAKQRAWQYLLQRRTMWQDDDKLRSQARSAIESAARQIAIEDKVDRRVTLSALQWDRLEDSRPCGWNSDDLDGMGDVAKLLLRVKAIRAIRKLAYKLPESEYRAVRRAACDYGFVAWLRAVEHRVDEAQNLAYDRELDAACEMQFTMFSDRD
jgi:hypothetical protein